MKIFQCEQGITATIRLPGDVMISHLALILAAVKDGQTRIVHLNRNKEVETTIRALQTVGISVITEDTADAVRVAGRGLYGFTAPASPIDCGNSAATLFLLSSVLCAQPFSSILTCSDPGIHRIDRLIRLLETMGADIYTENASGYPPVVIRGRSRMTGISFANHSLDPLLKYCVCLADLYAGSTSDISDPAGTPDHAERLIRCLSEDTFLIPADFTCAAYFLALGAILPGSCIRLPGTGINDTRTCFLDVLSSMGADIAVENFNILNGEPSADLVVRAAQLHRRDIFPEELPGLHRELLPLCLTLQYAPGPSLIMGLADLSFDELERLERFLENMHWLHGNIKLADYVLTIKGGSALTGAAVRTFSDPELIMIHAVAALISNGCTILDTEADQDLPYPDFLKTVSQLSG